MVRVPQITKTLKRRDEKVIIWACVEPRLRFSTFRPQNRFIVSVVTGVNSPFPSRGFSTRGKSVIKRAIGMRPTSVWQSLLLLGFYYVRPDTRYY